MAPRQRKRRDAVLLKTFILAVACLALAGILSCDGTKSTTGSGGTSGTGTGWNITIIIGSASIPLDGETSVLALVKDGTGAPAPFGTNICFTAIRGDFIKDTDSLATICETTSNNLGQSIQTYRGTETGQDTIQVSSQGVIATAEIIVY
jgi:hypothetical protein